MTSKDMDSGYTAKPKPLDGQVAVVTGASAGIGKAITLTLSKAGCKVAMAARSLDKLKDLEKEVECNGDRAISFQTDVTKREQVRELIRQTEEKLGPVDILINNAGTCYYTMMRNVHEEEWERQVDVNIKGVNNCIAAVLPGMLDRKKGHIVNMSSNGGRKGCPGLAVYAGTKFYVEGMSQSLRQELRETGVKVTCIQPGDVSTNLFDLTTDSEAREAYIPENGKYSLLQADDVANAVLYALTQPEYVAVNEILVEPRELPI